jgi:hypothetical protein
LDLKEIVQSFTSAGWALDDSFADDLIIGYDGGYLSILAHRESWDSEDPAFEIIDHERNITYWVQEILTPQQATELLQEHGQVPEG